MRSRSFAVSLMVLAIGLIAIARPALADSGNDRVSFGNRIVIEEGESVGDVVCFFCSVESHGKINGDVVTFLGNVKTTEQIQGDVVAFAGSVSLDDEASIGGDLVIFGGSLRKAANAGIRHEQVIFPSVIFFAPILLIIAIIWAISAVFRRRHPIYYIPPAR